MPLLFAYGHSYVEGAGASEPQLGFAQLLSAITHSSLHNLGVGGSLSHQTATEVDMKHHAGADVVVLMTGLNDARLYGEQRSALMAYESALARMFTNFAAASTQALVIAVEQPPLLDYSQHAPFENGSDALVEQYNHCLRNVASRFPQVRIARVEDWDAALMLAHDTVHPNDLGHQEIAKAILRAWLGTDIEEQR